MAPLPTFKPVTPPSFNKEVLQKIQNGIPPSKLPQKPERLSIYDRCPTADCLCSRFVDEHYEKCVEIVERHRPGCLDFWQGGKLPCKKYVSGIFNHLESENSLRELSMKVAELAAKDAKESEEVKKKRLQKQIETTQKDIQSLQNQIDKAKSTIQSNKSEPPERTLYLYENQHNGELLEHAGKFYVAKPPLKYVGNRKVASPRQRHQRYKSAMELDRLQESIKSNLSSIKSLKTRLKKLQEESKKSGLDVDQWLSQARTFWSTPDAQLNRQHPLPGVNQDCSRSTYSQLIEEGLNQCEQDACVAQCGSGEQCISHCYAKYAKSIKIGLHYSTCRVLTPNLERNLAYLFRYTYPQSAEIMAMPLPSEIASICEPEVRLIYP